MKIGVYVGSFNPVHKGHQIITEELIERKIVDKIIIVPTGNYWDKTNLIDIKHRIKMLKLIASKNVIVNEKLNDLSYTYQILDAINLESGGDEIYFIIGSDNYQTLKQWKNYKEVISYPMLVINRLGSEITQKINNKVTIININLDKEYASTIIRNKVQNNEKVLDYLDDSVAEYINANNLYKENDYV